MLNLFCWVFSIPFTSKNRAIFTSGGMRSLITANRITGWFYFGQIGFLSEVNPIYSKPFSQMNERSVDFANIGSTFFAKLSWAPAQLWKIQSWSGLSS